MEQNRETNEGSDADDLAEKGASFFFQSIFYIASCILIAIFASSKCTLNEQKVLGFIPLHLFHSFTVFKL